MDRSTKALFAVLLLMVVLRDVGLDSEWLVTLNLVLAYLLAAFVAFGQYDYRVRGGYVSAILGLQAVLTLLVAVTITWHAEVEGLEVWGLFGTYLAMLVLVVAQSSNRSSLRTNAPYVLGYALVTGVFVYHVLSVPSTSGLALFPVFAAVVLGVNLLVLPRYVPEPFFRRSIALVATLFATVGLWSAVIGEYSLLGFEARIWRMRSVPLLGNEVPIVQSVFANPNTLGLVLFPGLVAAVVEFHRLAIERRSRWRLAFVPVIPITGVGLYLTNSRASMLAAAVGLVVYAAYVLAGRRGIPAGLVVAYGGIVAALVGMVALFPDADGNRLALWNAGLEAYLDSPTYLGKGLVGTSELIAPYLSGGGSVHNSYLSILLRTGIVGLIGYLLVVVAPTLHAAIRRDTVSPAAVALASAFVVHQLFEAYTLYQYGFGSVVGTLATGYVIVSLDPTNVRSGDVPTEDVVDDETEQGGWARPERSRPTMVVGIALRVAVVLGVLYLLVI